MKETLIALIRELSYREGDFTLASGQKSRFYINLKATTLHPRGAQAIGKTAIPALQAAGLLAQIEAVGGLTLGADPIATAVSLAALEHGIEWPAFIVRKETKGHGTSQKIEGCENLRSGARVLVVEDVSTTGGSALQAVQSLRDAGYLPVGVLTVVDREQGAREQFAKEGLPLVTLVRLPELLNGKNGC